MVHWLWSLFTLGYCQNILRRSAIYCPNEPKTTRSRRSIHPHHPSARGDCADLSASGRREVGQKRIGFSRLSLDCLDIYGRNGFDYEILFVKRKDSARFMPGYHVFPGGITEKSDEIGEDHKLLPQPLPVSLRIKSLAPPKFIAVTGRFTKSIDPDITPGRDSRSI